MQVEALKPVSEPRGVVLLVDDDLELLRAHERVLMRAGYLVHTAQNGRQATEKLAIQRFDAVISDISMPEMDGIELLRAVRGKDLCVPVVLITANPVVETAMAAVEFGALQYMTKPVATEALIAVANRAVKLGSLSRERDAAQAEGGLVPTDRAGLEVCFQRALDKTWMAYQPIVVADVRTVLAHEALLRTEDTTLPLVGAILRAAEKLGRVHDLGRHVRAMVAERMTKMEHASAVFVNLHPNELTDEELYDPASPLSNVASRVILEITERATLDEISDVPGRMKRLRALGYGIAVDDMGAGYSGLASFALLEPDMVKIDMSLIRDIHKEPVKVRLVKSVMALAQETGLAVVAEGVETEEERDALVAIGCVLHQGYLYGRPVRETAADIKGEDPS